MQKRKVLYTVSAIGAGTMSFLLLNKDKRKNIKNKYDQIVHKKTSMPIRTAGVPEEDNAENAKMVAEGSQFGVQYYNHHMKNR
ncbi:hypothetical protein NC661_09620 [Aquibacillus koreensis]|uniref:YbyB n=1 Tax=Aquibacillus koreensis TaxID=279446 RepID=A0A9X4AJP1_9BACI|nr:hypothetical protein [Aquibacillus koreensis]MCT2538102.1 hypothetical protein [Aquibacillus koreensis]MDC3420625.1 hypothetical protein [Aquibacillus koreensis]